MGEIYALEETGSIEVGQLTNFPTDSVKIG